MSSETQYGWHVEPGLLARYAGGDVNGSTAASVEAHLLACAGCRAALAPSVDPARLAAVWDEVLDRVDAPRPTFVEQLLLRLGVAEHTARLVCSARSLTVSWLTAVVAALGFALLAADAGGRGVLLFLAIAPIARSRESPRRTGGRSTRRTKSASPRRTPPSGCSCCAPPRSWPSRC